MVSVNEFVEASIAAHPTMFTNRTEVLHFVLCVNGNGYDWGENGEPVYFFEDEHAFNRDAYVEREMSNLRKTLSADTLEVFRRMVELDVAELEQIVAEAAQRATMRGEIKRGDVYQQTEYALLAKMPENATSDWREACDEIREVVVKAGWVL